MLLIGNKLKELRRSRGLTLEQTSKLLGVAVSTVSSYESDTRKPSYEVLFRYAENFSALLDFIFGTERRKDSLSRLNYEHRKSIDDFAEFLLSKEQQSTMRGDFKSE